MVKKVTLMSLAIPIFFEVVLFMTLGVVDTLMLSRISDQAAGAVGIANQLINFTNIIFTIISVGAAILIAQFIGAKKWVDCHMTIIVAYVVLTIIGLICSIGLFFFGPDLLILIGITPGLMGYASDYIRIVGIFMFLQAFLNISTVTMRSYGYSKQTLYITATMNIINIVGDYALLFGAFGLPALGAAGVAIATSISRLIAVILSTIFVFKHIVPLSAITYIKNFPKHILRLLLKLGFPAALENLSYNVSQIVITGIVLVYLGEEMSIVRTYVGSIVTFALIITIAISQANQIIIGRLIGEGLMDEAYHVCIKNFRIAFYVMCGIGVIFYFFGGQLMRIFSDNPSIIEWGMIILALDAFLELGRIFNIVFISGLRGAGDVIFSVAIGLVFMWGIAAAGAYVFVVIFDWGLPGVWLALLLDEWVRGILNFLRWHNKKWVTKALV
jgi:putative MATE family efflux protein